MAADNLKGRTFGWLTVREEAERRNGRRMWRCTCICGKEVVAEESHLKRGHTKSCGCYRRAKAREKLMDLTGQRFGRLTALGPVQEADRTVSYWRCRCDCGKEVICHKENLRAGITRSCGCLLEEQRKKNMEKAIHIVDGTCVEKIASRRTASNNTSGHRGVYRRGEARWSAAIGFKGKLYNLGSFRSFEEAVNARLEAEKRYYDTFLEEYRKNQ